MKLIAETRAFLLGKIAARCRLQTFHLSVAMLGGGTPSLEGSWLPREFAKAKTSPELGAAAMSTTMRFEKRIQAAALLQAFC
jgi:hypothetical protein